MTNNEILISILKAFDLVFNEFFINYDDGISVEFENKKYKIFKHDFEVYNELRKRLEEE